MMVNSGLSGGLYDIYIYMVGGAISVLKNMSSSMGRMTSLIYIYMENEIHVPNHQVW